MNDIDRILDRVHSLENRLASLENRYGGGKAVFVGHPCEIIKYRVAEHFGTPVIELEAQTRKQPIVFHRQVAMWLTRKFTTLSDVEVGEKFGGRDHGTVSHSCSIVEERMENEPRVRTDIDQLALKISEDINQKVAPKQGTE